MLRKYGNHYIDTVRVTSVSPMEWDNDKIVKYQLSISIEGTGCILAIFQSEQERDEALRQIVAEAEQNYVGTTTACDDVKSHDYVDGFKAGVDYALKLAINNQ